MNKQHIELNYSMSLEEMLKAARLDWKCPWAFDFTDFPVKGEGAVKMPRVVHLGIEMNLDDLKSLFKKDNLRGANRAELALLGANLSDVLKPQVIYGVEADGKSFFICDGAYSPGLYTTDEDNDWDRARYECDSRWGPHVRFAVVDL